MGLKLKRKIKKSKPKIKHVSLNRFKNKVVWPVFSKYIRLRDCLLTTGTKVRGKCITCDVELPIGELQAGHFLQGRHNAYLFSEEGVHAQCKTCNILKRGNQLKYRRKIIELYGDKYDEILEEDEYKDKKFTLSELEELLEYYKKKIKELENGR